ncbi:MAG TPA: hypothetical protein VKI62_06090, partial [Bacteroidota bacterium]|nr:hypothetical protein [Bacteroidota bacterium]
MSIPSSKSKSKALLPDHSTAYSYFYRYASFILFAKEVDRESYMDIRQLYLSPANKSYKEDFRAFVTQWKSLGRKATSDDLELIFSMVKDTQSTVSTVRSASIKRAGTVAKTLRSPMGDGLSRADKERERSEQEGKTPVGEIFGEILEVFIPAMIKEQSFILGFLHLSPNGKTFDEFVAPGVDKSSWLRNLDKKRSPELDKNASNEIMNAMDQLLSWLP